ncbi:MAG: Ig-like domain-containing protein [Candidatus Peribacteraceae bacterium]|nr:Ig-like domain-containing protein [Candidatus Peribacteraceae bacterium]
MSPKKEKPVPAASVKTSSNARLKIGGAIAAVCILGAIGVGIYLQQQSMQPFNYSQTIRVSPTSELRMNFPELMDEQSTESELSKPADVSGSMEWRDGVLVFRPSEKLKTGKDYIFTVTRNAKKKDGTLLGRDIKFTFQVSGAPAVVAHFPASDTKDIKDTSKITMIFDQPLIALTQVQGEASKKKFTDWPVAISPPVEGTWHWLSTTTVEFIPKTGLNPSTKYTVSVPAGIKTASGDATDKDFSWSFETIRPTVEETMPENAASFIGPKTDITLQYNQPMDVKSAEQKIRLYAGNTSQMSSSVIRNDQFPPASPESTSSTASTTPIPSGFKPVAIRSIRYGTTEENGKAVQDQTKLVIVPAASLQFATAYNVHVDANIVGKGGNLGSTQDYSLSFTTAGDLLVSTGSVTLNGGISLSFTNPILTKNLKPFITISPEPEDWKDLTMPEDDYEGGTTYVSLTPTLKPSTEYTVTIKAGLTDTFGQKLAKPYTFKQKTREMEPRAFFHTKGDFGFFEKTRPPVYYVNSVNISKVDFEFAKLSLADFVNYQQVRTNSWDNPPVTLEGKNSYKAWSIVPPGAKHDEWKATTFDVQKQVGQTLGSGIYALSISAPEYAKEVSQPNLGRYDESTVITSKKEKIKNYQFFALTNMAITLKYSGTRTLAWVTNIQTGNPVSGAVVNYVNYENKTVLSGRTDANGFFEANIPYDQLISTTNYSSYAQQFWVTAEKDGDFAFVSNTWNQGIQPYDFDGVSGYVRDPSRKFEVQSYLYTERPLYRPGDTIYFKAMTRLMDLNGKLNIPANYSADVKIYNPKGDVVYNKKLPINSYGSFNDNFVLANAAELGYYYVQADLSNGDDVLTNSVYGNFSVLAYRKPEYSVEVKPAKEEYVNGEVIEADIEGAYYFGAPMANATVKWRATTTDYYFNKYDYSNGWYSFGTQDGWCWMNCERGSNNITEGTGTLDASGHLRIRFPANIDANLVSQVVSIEADITDANNQIVSNRSSVVVHKTNVYVGVKTDDYVVTPGSKAKVSVVTLNPDGTPKKGQAVTLKLSTRQWNSVRKKGVDGEFYYDNEKKDTFVNQISVTTDEKGKGTGEIAVNDGGEYVIAAVAKDEGGRETVSETSLYSWSNTYYNWPHSNNDRIAIVADKPEYAVGDIAKLLVKSPYQGKGVKALVTVERESVVTKKIVDITSNALPIEIPITEDLLPNAYVSVVIIKPRQGETFDETGLDTGMPAFKIGYIKLAIETKAKKLNVAVSVDKERYLPGEKVTATIKVTDWQGKPQKAETSLGVVDMSVLALTGFQLPDLMSHFYYERSLGVSTSNMLMYLVERFKPGSKGGGGGDPEERKRMNLKDTAFWNPTILTNDKGEATVTFTLPDNLTTWQLLAIANTKDSRFGAKDGTFLETKHVIVRPVRPRFAVIGDEAKLGAIVHNFLPTTQTFVVSLKGTGFTIKGSATQKVTVKPDEQTKVEFPVAIDVTNKATFVFKAEAAGGKDEIEESIPVYEFGTPQAVATSGVTETNQTEKILIPSAKDASHGTLSVSVSPTIASYLPKGLEYLFQYPYGCSEQTMSSVLPDIVLAKMQGFEAFHIMDQKKLDTTISTTMQKLYGFQRGDGGFGYWQDSDRSNVYLTTYIVYGLQIAKTAGYTIDANVLSRARDYITTILHNPNATNPNAEYSDKFPYLALAERAYILFVLSEGGQNDVSMMNAVYDKRNELPLFSKAQLAMALKNAKTSATDKKAATLMTEILAYAQADNRGIRFEEDSSRNYAYLMNTDTRTTSQVLQAMVRIDPTNVLAPRIVRYLLSVRNQYHWDTTQSTTTSLLALMEYLNMTKELDGKFTATVDISGQNLLKKDFGKTNILERVEAVKSITELARGKEVDLNLAKQGTGKMYYDAVLSYFYTNKDLPAADEGISISRTMEPIAGSAKTVSVGNTYKVRLTITVPEDRQYVAVESPLPAGMEAIDLSLQTSQTDLLSGEVNQPTTNYGYSYWYGWTDDYIANAMWRFTHKEFRDDQVFLFADYLPTGVYQYEYLVRATTPGHFHYRPARAYQMYYPEIFGQTDGSWFDIK